MMISAAAAAQHSPYNWDFLWGLLSGVGGVAALITLLLTIPTYVSNRLSPFKVTSANYQVASDNNSMSITITVKNRHDNERSLTALIIGQPPAWWRRLWPKWWFGRIRWKLYDIGIDITTLGSISPGNSETFDSVALTRVEGTPVSDTLPSNARVLAYCGADRPYVKRPKKIAGLPSPASKPTPKDTAAPAENGPEAPESVTQDPPAS
jgi:hypothetical protein